jgi:methylenetetrahydrofolate dehydrogenase (NADP+)/methenyltetrahydrofolate cyclohydrolase
MSATLIDGKAIAQKILDDAQKRTERLRTRTITPSLEVILVGDDKPSATYVRKKGEAAEKIGINFKLHTLPASTSAQELKDFINARQANPELTGLIVQLPLPESLSRETAEIIETIKPEIDVDCMTATNMGYLTLGEPLVTPPTPGACMSILEDLGVNVSGKNVTIVGMGPLVGKPLAVMMINAGASVTTVNSRTKNVTEKCLSADIIVTGVGKKDLLRGTMVAEGAIVIDTGVDFENGKMFGDVNVAEVSEKASHVTPTPGGVGPITVARLLLNTVICAEKKYGV